MQNNTPYGYFSFPHEHGTEQTQLTQWTRDQPQSTNRFIYMNQQHTLNQDMNKSQKVLVNPHFQAKSKVFVNPNFTNQTPRSGGSIHVNPHVKSKLSLKMDPIASKDHNTTKNTKIYINPHAKSVPKPQTVHINPKFSNLTTPLLGQAASTIPSYEVKENLPVHPNKLVVLTKTKLIRKSNTPNVKKVEKRRNSLKSKYKLIKSGLSPKRQSPQAVKRDDMVSKSMKNRFKIDNRRTMIRKSQKFVYNKIFSVSDLARTKIIKKNHNSKSLVNISGIVYRKSRNTLRRASVSSTRDSSIKKKPTLNTRYRINNTTKTKTPIYTDSRTKIVKKFKIIRRPSPKKQKEGKISPRKLRKCNIPCPNYRKYGLCKGKDIGKCFLKHDPDQIALCTRFLQGACVKEKCLLSHKVSPEKMPTCKFYLEGSCSKETCPYLHVKISPKAEVCRDFIEGFCKKAAECDKRHQYLCPDFEKYGKCIKQRCQYPHGKMVRTYLINKNKFAQKSSDQEAKESKALVNLPSSSKTENANEKRRYYIEKKSKSEENIKELPKNLELDINLKTFVGLQSRPKLGSLPSFIPFGDS